MVNRITDGVRTLLSNNPSTGRSLKELAKSPFLYGRVEPTSSGNAFGASEARETMANGRQYNLGQTLASVKVISDEIAQIRRWLLVAHMLQELGTTPDEPFTKALKRFNKKAKQLRK